MKFGFVTPRYGADIPGGCEHVCRLLAEQVSQRHSVDVLTTCARDPRTWKNEYSEGADRVRGVLVRRFAVNQEHDRTAFRHLSTRMYGRPNGHEDEQEWVGLVSEPVMPAVVACRCSDGIRHNRSEARDPHRSTAEQGHQATEDDRAEHELPQKAVSG